MSDACLPVFTRRLDGTRLRLPRPLRAAFARSAAASAGPSGCVVLTPSEAWAPLLPRLQRCSAHDAHAAGLFQLLAASGAVVPVDCRGRLSLPALHLEWAGISSGGDVVLVALTDAVEVWEPRRLRDLLSEGNRRLRELHAHILREQLPLFEGLGAPASGSSPLAEGA